jgi:hypothetical protein
MSFSFPKMQYCVNLGVIIRPGLAILADIIKPGLAILADII